MLLKDVPEEVAPNDLEVCIENTHDMETIQQILEEDMGMMERLQQLFDNFPSSVNTPEEFDTFRTSILRWSDDSTAISFFPALSSFYSYPGFRTLHSFP